MAALVTPLRCSARVRKCITAIELKEINMLTNETNEAYFTHISINGIGYPDFGFRSFVAHLNDYDLFYAYAPCYEAETNAHITAYYQCL
jgi:hypothetical protein